MVFLKKFDDLTNIELLEIMQLRQEVFMVEQAIIEIDIDEYDPVCLHAFIKSDGHIVSYARLVDKHDQLYIGRVVTKKAYRNQGFSTEIMKYFIERNDVLAVSAQVPVIPFYKELGFKEVGKKYKEAGIPHQKMVFIK